MNAFASFFPSNLRPRTTPSRHRCTTFFTRQQHHVCAIRAMIDNHPQSLDYDPVIPLISTNNESTFSDHSSFENVQDATIDTSTGAGGGDSRSGDGSNRGGDNFDNDSDDDLPYDLREALALGIVGREAVSRYRSFLKLPLLGWLIYVPAFRTRMLADASFFFKLLVQEVVGNGTALASEIAVRGRHIKDELEYVASDLIVGTVVEAAFVWLLAPTLALPSSKTGGVVANFIQSLPANAFVANSPTQTFTIPLRLAAFLYAGAQYMVIGVVAGIVGTAITYGLIEGRKAIDKNYVVKRPMPDVLPNALAWGAFMAISSNTRFQIVEGMERGIAHLCGGAQKPAVNAGIVALRFGNNYWGGVQFVQFFRWIGLHAVEDEHDAVE